MNTTIIKDVDRDYLRDGRILEFIAFLFKRFDINCELELNILFSDDERIAILNKQFRDKDKSTDILSFYGYDGDILGDIIISVETMEREAKENNKDTFFYTLFLLSHGFLHLLGYTHETIEKYNKMIEMQNKLIKEWEDEVK